MENPAILAPRSVIDDAVVLVDGYEVRGRLVLPDKVADLESEGIARLALAASWQPVHDWAFLVWAEVTTPRREDTHITRLMAVRRSAIRAISTNWT